MTAPAGIAWATLEQALYTWALSMTGLSVVWNYEDAPQSDRAFLVMNISSPVRETGIDEERWETDLSRVGKEVVISSHAWINFTLSIDCFSNSKAPTGHALYYLNLINGVLFNDQYRETINNVGLSVVRAEAIQDLTEIENGGHVSRANLDIVFRAAMNVVPGDAMGQSYIKTVGATSDISGVSTDLNLDDETLGDLS